MSLPNQRLMHMSAINHAARRHSLTNEPHVVYVDRKTSTWYVRPRNAEAPSTAQAVYDTEEGILNEDLQDQDPPR